MPAGYDALKSPACGCWYDKSEHMGACVSRQGLQPGENHAVALVAKRMSERCRALAAIAYLCPLVSPFSPRCASF